MPVFLELMMLFLTGVLGAIHLDGFRLAAPPSDVPALGEAPAGDDEPTAQEERIVLPASAQGYDRREIRGQLCADGYTRGFTGAMMSGSGLCMVEGWASDDPKDCRVRVHLQQGPQQSGVCTVTVYESPM